MHLEFDQFLRISHNMYYMLCTTYGQYLDLNVSRLKFFRCWKLTGPDPDIYPPAVISNRRNQNATDLDRTRIWKVLLKHFGLRKGTSKVAFWSNTTWEEELLLWDLWHWCVSLYQCVSPRQLSSVASAKGRETFLNKVNITQACSNS